MSQSAARHAHRHAEPVPPEVERALRAAAEQEVVFPPKQTTYPACRIEIERMPGGMLALALIYPPTGVAHEVIVAPFDQKYARSLAARLLNACTDPEEPATGLVGPDGQPVAA